MQYTYNPNEQIGDKGGFGAVYKCTAESGQEYAIKFLENTDPAAVDRFQKEIRLTMRLSHPNVIKIISYNVDGDRKWYIMPLYQSSLAAVIPSLYGQYSRQYNIISEILDGVIYLHDQGVLHRDLKPQNILYNSDSDIVINDFGLGRQIDSDSTRLTRLGAGFGTYRYMAPEQGRNASTADQRSDIFSLGRIIEDIITDFSTNPVPESDLEYIVNRCTQPSPGKRFASVKDLKSAIDSVYQKLLGIIEHDVTEGLLTSLKLGTATSEEIHKLAINLLTTHNGDQLEAFFHNISDSFYQEIEESDSNLAEKLIIKLQEYYTGQGWGFGYTDTIGDNCKRLYSISSNAIIRANLLYTIIEVGISHNRWYVMGIAANLLKSANSNVSECLELSTLLSGWHGRLSSLNIGYGELPPCLQPYYSTDTANV